MKISMKSYEGKEVEIELDEEGETEKICETLDVLCRYFVGVCKSGDREFLKELGIWDKVEED